MLEHRILTRRYFAGQHMHSGKLHYISANPGGGAATLSGASSVYCVVGTPPQWRRYSKLLWRQGPALLLEDVNFLYYKNIFYHFCSNKTKITLKSFFMKIIDT